MERILAGVFALVLFATVLILGLVRNLPFEVTLTRALVSGVIGAALGWIVFGPLGQAILKDSLPKVAPYPEAPKESPKGGAPPGPMNPPGSVPAPPPAAP